MFPNWTGWKTVKILLFILTGFATLVPEAWRPLYTTTLAAVGSIVVVLSGTPMGPSVVGKAAVKLLPLVVLFGLAGAVEACSAAQTKLYTDTAGTLCQVIVTATDPALAPLCTDATSLAEAIEALVGADGGIGAARPSQDAIYQYLATHGAKPLAR